MSQQIIDTSTETDTLPDGFDKVNDNFTEVYASIIQTGMMIDYFGTTAPSGWVLARGETIGNSGSSADYKINTENLFVLLWNSTSDTYCPVSGGRVGPNAIDDFNAGKTLTLPDSRGKVSVGKDSATFSEIGRSSIGSETVTLVENNLPSHTHNVEIPSSTGSVQSGGDGGFLTNLSTSPTATSSTGSASPVSIIQPSLVCNKIIKL